MDSGFRRNDEFYRIPAFYEFINFEIVSNFDIRISDFLVSLPGSFGFPVIEIQRIEGE